MMFLLFSRPPEFWGISTFFIILACFAVIFAVSGAALLISFLLADGTTPGGKAVKSWVAASVALAAVFAVGNLLLAIPAIIFLFFVQAFVVESVFDSSDETFHKIDNFLTFFGIAVNLIGYLWAVKFFRRKIYSRFFEGREKK